MTGRKTIRDTKRLMMVVIERVAMETGKSVSEVERILKAEIDYSKPAAYSVEHVIKIFDLHGDLADLFRIAVTKLDKLLYPEKAKVLTFRRRRGS